MQPDPRLDQFHNRVRSADVPLVLDDQVEVLEGITRADEVSWS